MAHDGVYAIVGGSKGIGAACARALAARGLRPFLIARDPVALAAQAGALGCGWAAADALDEAALAASFAQAGPLRGLVFAVGSIVLKPLARTTPKDFLDAYALNVVAAASAVRLAAPALAADPATPGGVVLFSSVAARQGFAMHAAIAAAKGAVESLTLAAELARAIRVNCVAPSLTRTDLAAKLLGNPAMEKSLAAAHPMGRLGEADDAGALAAFLAGPDSGWITGQIVGVDGGRGALRVRGQ
jgi:NAD(P)-dependent dehydrogenase (short-subunit alcohol dehydrogenase family)